jgi:hypothetical protein
LLVRPHGAAGRKANRIEPSFHDSVRLTLIRLASGPIFRSSEAWQLTINTITNVGSVLMIEHSES